MKIAIVTEHFLPKNDGVVARVCNTLHCLKRLGHQVELFTIMGGPDEYEGARVNGFPGFSVPFYRSRKTIIPSKKIGESLNAWQPDLVHVVNPCSLGLYAEFYARKQSWPCVLSIHTDYAEYAQHYHLGAMKKLIWMLMRKSAALASVTLCTSSMMQRKCKSQHIEANLWPYGIDVAQFKSSLRDSATRDYLTKNQSDRFLFICPGRLAPEKDLFRLKDILITYPNVSLALIGDGPSKEKLKKHFEGTACHITGQMDKQALAKAYASADALVFPSQTETLGFVLLEAMASGIPVIAACAGGIVDIVEDGVNGLLYDPLNQTELLAKCGMLMNNARLIQNLVSNGNQTVKNATWESATKTLVNFYELAIKAHKVKGNMNK